MKICSLSQSIGKALQALGHEVLILHQYELPRVLDIAAELRKRNFAPDLLFQEELLGERVLLQGLKELDCPKVYWSVDTHLNLFWHEWYTKLFDGVATPHVSLLKEANCIDRPVLRLARVCSGRPWKSFGERARDIGFVGRITRQRPRRKWLSDFLLDGYDAAVAQDMSLAEMFAFYLDSRLAPNESIMQEVNFRLVEAASCGCLVLSPPVGEDQDALFEPGREFLEFHDVLELKSLLDYYTVHTADAEKLGHAAWRRFQAEHLPVHRAQALLDFANALPARAAKGIEAESIFGVVLWRLYKGGRIEAAPQRLDDYLRRMPLSKDVFLALVGLHVFEGRLDAAMALTKKALAARSWQESLCCNAAGSAVALLAGDHELALVFWYRHCKLNKIKPVKPATGCSLMLLWAREFEKAGRVVRHGEMIAERAIIPDTAYECLVLAKQLGQGGPEGLEAVIAMDRLLGKDSRLDSYRREILDFLKELHPQDWRMALDMAGLELRAFRMQQGVELATLAGELAAADNQSRAFAAALKSMDHSGALTRLLHAAD